MDELKKGAMIEITLFQENNLMENPKQNPFLKRAQFSQDPSKGQYPGENKAQWEEASNVKNKNAVKTLGLKQNNFVEIKNRLAFIKRLRKNEKISEEEYQARKRKLLDQL